MSHKAFKLNRRDLIKQFGLASGLLGPLLNSRVVFGQAAQRAPTRVLLIAQQHGWGYDADLGPITGTATNFTLPEILAPFNPIKQHCIFVDAVRGTQWGNAHDVSYSDIFTAAAAYGETSSSQLGSHFPEPMGASLDWLIGNQLGVNVLRTSAGYNSWGRQFHPLCFNANNVMQPMYTSALETYNAVIRPLEALQQNGGVSLPPADQSLETNLLSFLGRDASRLLAAVPTAQRSKVETYLQSLDSLSQRILQDGQQQTINPIGQIPPAPAGNANQDMTLDHFLDFYHLVFQADTHRVGVLGIGGPAIDNYSWRDINNQVQMGQSWGGYHHEVAHYGGKEANRRRAYIGSKKHSMDKIVRFVQKLAATPDVDGHTLLDNTLILLTGEVSNGNHETRQQMHIVIGGGGGKITPGRWLQLPKVGNSQNGGRNLNYQRRDGSLVDAVLNYGSDYAVHHHADVLTRIGQVAGLNLNRFGLNANNRSPIQL